MLHFAALSLTVACVASLSLAARHLLVAVVTGGAALAACVLASGVNVGLVIWCVLLMAVSSVLVLVLTQRPDRARMLVLGGSLLGGVALVWLGVV